MLQDQENDAGPQFAEVFVVYWLGATVVTLNIKLLGGSMYVYSVYDVSYYPAHKQSGEAGYNFWWHLSMWVHLSVCLHAN